LEYLRSNKPEILKEIAEKKEISKELEQKMHQAVQEFKKSFVV
jgi:F-type H+-transporting ATPase subunit alpha